MAAAALLLEQHFCTKSLGERPGNRTAILKSTQRKCVCLTFRLVIEWFILNHSNKSIQISFMSQHRPKLAKRTIYLKGKSVSCLVKTTLAVRSGMTFSESRNRRLFQQVCSHLAGEKCMKEHMPCKFDKADNNAGQALRLTQIWNQWTRDLRRTWGLKEVQTLPLWA